MNSNRKSDKMFQAIGMIGDDTLIELDNFLNSKTDTIITAETQTAPTQRRRVKLMSLQFGGLAAATLALVVGTVVMFRAFAPDDTLQEPDPETPYLSETDDGSRDGNPLNATEVSQNYDTPYATHNLPDNNSNGDVTSPPGNNGTSAPSASGTDTPSSSVNTPNATGRQGTGTPTGGTAPVPNNPTASPLRTINGINGWRIVVDETLREIRWYARAATHELSLDIAFGAVRPASEILRHAVPANGTAGSFAYNPANGRLIGSIMSNTQIPAGALIFTQDFTGSGCDVKIALFTEGNYVPKPGEPIFTKTTGADGTIYVGQKNHRVTITDKMLTEAIADGTIPANVGELSITNGRGITDLSPLSSLTNLGSLHINDVRATTLSPLRYLTKLWELNLPRGTIRDLSGLENLTNLQSIRIWEHQVSDLTPLSGLTNVAELVLYSNNISDISPLRTMTGLGFVNLSGNPIRDLTPLGVLPNLYTHGASNPNNEFRDECCDKVADALFELAVRMIYYSGGGGFDSSVGQWISYAEWADKYGVPNCMFCTRTRETLACPHIAPGEGACALARRVYEHFLANR
jgi:hypothetical protein